MQYRSFSTFTQSFQWTLDKVQKLRKKVYHTASDLSKLEINQNQMMIRKSRRLQQRQKTRKQKENQPVQIQNRSKSKAKKQIQQKHRTLAEKVKHPSETQINDSQVIFKDNRIFYSITTYEKQYCKKHRNLEPETVIGSQNCPSCLDAGVYYLNEHQISKLNPNLFRRIVQRHLAKM